MVGFVLHAVRTLLRVPLVQRVARAADAMRWQDCCTPRAIARAGYNAIGRGPKPDAGWLAGTIRARAPADQRVICVVK